MNNDWIQKKSNALDDLIKVTSCMLEDYQKGFFENSGKFLNMRKNLTDILQECDKNLEEPIATKSNQWLEKLHTIQELDKQIDEQF